MNKQDKLYRDKIKWDSDGCHSILYKGKYYITLYNDDDIVRVTGKNIYKEVKSIHSAKAYIGKIDR